MNNRKLVVIGYLGSVLDSGFHEKRWQKWRPTISLCRHQDLPVSRVELIHQAEHEHLARCVAADIPRVSAGTTAQLTPQSLKDPWDFQVVFESLHDFARRYPWKPDQEDYLIHITTGTHVQQICLFLLTESRHLPGRLVQTSPLADRRLPDGRYNIIDLDLSKYDRIASRFEEESAEALSFLKSGIATRNDAFNRLIEQIEKVAVHSRAPMLLMGPTGAGKSQLARRVFELKKLRHQLRGAFVEVNCATIRGDGAGSALFGHVKGAFTGAAAARKGHLLAANGGVLFLDEIGELGADEQAMLLRAIEEKRFFPEGADKEAESDFQLIAGTNRDLRTAVREGRFRDDLLARINLWTFRLPALRERTEDIEPNLDYELDQFTRQTGTRVTFNKEARERFVRFATSPGASWAGNFRDLNAAVYRMATLAAGQRIGAEVVDDEITRLRANWEDAVDPSVGDGAAVLSSLLTADELEQLDLFDRAQLEFVVQICRESESLSAAGRKLYSVSREKRKDNNDADRLRKYLLRFGLNWRAVRAGRLEADAKEKSPPGRT